MSSVRNLKGCQKALSHIDLEAKATNMLELQRHRFLCNTLQAQVKMSQFVGIQSHFHRSACIFIIRLNMISLKELLLWITVTFFFFLNQHLWSVLFHFLFLIWNQRCTILSTSTRYFMGNSLKEKWMGELISEKKFLSNLF